MLRERILTNSANLNVMIDAALKAGRGLVRDFGEIEKLQVSRKGTNDFVSNADKKAEKAVYLTLEKARPGYSYLMEEGGTVVGENPDYRWIIDPLDGTMNFLHGLPGFCVSIALEHKGEIISGVIYDPLLDEIFWAEKGKGAFLNSQRLRVSARKDIHESLCLIGFHGDAVAREKFLRRLEQLLNHQPVIRFLGSAALCLAYVAAGRADGYFEGDLKLWDLAAGKIILEESKGQISFVSEDTINVKDVLASSVDLYASLEKVFNISGHDALL